MQARLANRYLNTPWAVSSDLYSEPGSLVVKLVLGEAPASIPAAADVRRNITPAATAMTVGPVDQVLNHFTHRCNITCVHSAARGVGVHQHQHLQHAFDDIEHALGLSRTFRIKTTGDVSVSDLIDALRQLAVVEQAYADYITTLPFRRPVADQPLNLDSELAAWQPRDRVAAAAALAYEPGDPAVIVAVVDTGVAQMHPELTDRLRAGVDTVQIDTEYLAAGAQVVGDRHGVDTDPEDAVGHGTACAAIIAAQGRVLPPGLAGDCRVLPVRVLGAARFPGKDVPIGIGAISDIDQGVKYAIDLGAKVINMSFGTPESMLDPTDPLPHSDVVQYGLARGCVMIAASGNTGHEERFSPACLDGVIAVGAIGSDGQPTGFTTTGDHLALCAPGERVLSAGLQGYNQVTGTSFAAPFVAATAALLVSRAARRSHPLTGPDVRRILSDSATPWRQSTGERRGYGAGTLDAYRALRQLDQEIDRTRLPDEIPKNGRDAVTI